MSKDVKGTFKSIHWLSKSQSLKRLAIVTCGIILTGALTFVIDTGTRWLLSLLV